MEPKSARVHNKIYVMAVIDILRNHYLDILCSRIFGYFMEPIFGYCIAV